jgi:hypothetical protein
MRDRIIYFDYDEFFVRPAYAPLLERHAKHLAANPSAELRYGN